MPDHNISPPACSYTPFLMNTALIVLELIHGEALPKELFIVLFEVKFLRGKTYSFTTIKKKKKSVHSSETSI